MFWLKEWFECRQRVRANSQGFVRPGRHRDVLSRLSLCWHCDCHYYFYHYYDYYYWVVISSEKKQKTRCQDAVSFQCVAVGQNLCETLESMDWKMSPEPVLTQCWVEQSLILQYWTSDQSAVSEFCDVICRSVFCRTFASPLNVTPVLLLPLSTGSCMKCLRLT